MGENYDKKRLFIALNMPQEIKDELTALLEKLKKQIVGVKWVRADGFHITLHFLGYLDENLTKRVDNIMRNMAGRFGRIEFEMGGIGAFPNLERPRVIFLECRQTNGDSVFQLRKLLGQGLITLGIDIDDRPWKPHITLGRVRGNKKLRIKNVELKSKKNTINSFELMESRLSREGAEHNVILSCRT